MHKEYYGGNIPWLKTGDLNDGLITTIPEYITEEGLNNSSAKLNPAGSVLIAMYGATIGKIGILSIPATTNQACCACVDYNGIIQKYLFYFLLSHKEEFIALGGGGAQPNISKDIIVKTFIPIPPIQEQIRIVSEIECLLVLLDSLDNNKAALGNAINQAKSKILDLAIHGKLVPQDPADEPASELLKRISPNAIAPCDNPHYEQVPFEIPSNWVWATLGDITNYGKCSTVPVDDIDEESWVLELEDIEKDSAKVIKLCTKSDRDIKGVRHSFIQGYVLYSKLRTYLNKVLVANKDGFCTTEIIPIKCSNSIYPEYLCHVLRSKYFLDYTAQCGYGVKMPRLSTTDARKALVPLPPYEEQIKISAIIKELYCSLDSIAETLA